MDTVVNTGMHRDEAAQHLRISRIHDGIYSQPCNIALPDGHSISDYGNIGRLHNSIFTDALLQILILHRKNRLIHLSRHSDVHK